jgi:hypothetical protein
MNIKVHMEALAYITQQDKNAGIIMMMLLGRMNGDSVHVSITNLHKSTGIDKGSLRSSLRYLKEGRYLEADPEMDGFYVICPRLCPTSERPVRHNLWKSRRLPSFSPLEGPKAPKRLFTEVERMNTLTDEDIADAVFS